MPTIIDALLVTLNLDAKGFTRGQDEANKSLDNMKRRTASTADEIEKGSKRTNTSLRSIDTQASSVSKSVASSGEKMLAPFGALAIGIGAAVLSLDALKSAYNGAVATAASGAALGRAAGMSGINVTQYAAWGNAIAAAGGQAADAEASLSALADQQAAVQLGQRPSAAMQMLQQLGVNPMESPIQIMKDLASNRTLAGMSAAVRTNVLEDQLGLDAGSAYAISRGSGYVNQLLAQQAAKGNLTPEQVDTMTKFNTATNNLKQSFEQLKTNLDLDAMPALTGFENMLTGMVNWLDNKFPKWFHDNIAVPAEHGATIAKGVLNGPDLYSNGQQASIDQGMNALMAAGLTKAQAAGIMGNAQAESSFKLEPPVNSNNPHYGMFQWSQGRRQAILNATGIDVANASAGQQYKAALWELNNSPSLASLRTAFKNNPNMSPQQAAQMWNDYFERPGGYNPARGSYAANIFSGALDPRKQPLLPSSVESVLKNLRAARYGGSTSLHGATVHNNQYSITVHAPSGSAHDIAHTVTKAIKHQQQVSKLQTGGSVG